MALLVNRYKLEHALHLIMPSVVLLFNHVTYVYCLFELASHVKLDIFKIEDIILIKSYGHWYHLTVAAEGGG